MNNKDLFKKALENEMPDLEAIRKKCLNNSAKNESKVVIFKNTNIKRIVPAVACLMIIIIAFATLDFSNNSKNIIFNELNYDETTKKTVSSTKKKNKGGNNHQNNHYYTQSATVFETSAMTTEEEIKKTLPIKDNLNKSTKVSYISFNSFSELCLIASTFNVEESKVVFENGEQYILTIPESELSMILDSKKVYGFSVDGNIISNSGNISSNFCRGLTGCKFYTSYDGCSYTIGYSTYGNAFGGDIIETISSAQGYDFHNLGDGTYVAYIDGFCFSIQDNNDNQEKTKEFIENLSVFSKSI